MLHVERGDEPNEISEGCSRMDTKRRGLAAILVVGAALLVVNPANVFAQGRQKGQPTVATASIVLTDDMRVEIRNFYSAWTPRGVEALPPGIRKRLARGKPLPPGIAKRAVPEGLKSRVRIPDGYRLVEVGLDVLLVEAATNVVHDVLRDVIR